jgi:hypothetical protein
MEFSLETAGRPDWNDSAEPVVLVESSSDQASLPIGYWPKHTPSAETQP